MEKAASENQIAWLKSDVNNTWSSDEQSASRARKKVKELLQKLKGLHSGGSNSKQGQVREISEKLNTEFSLRQAEKRRTFELTEKLLASGKGGYTANVSNASAPELARRLQGQIGARLRAQNETKEVKVKLAEQVATYELTK